MTTPFTIERLQDLLEMARATKEFSTEMSRDMDIKMSLRVLQWVQIDFEANPSADNYQRMELAMKAYQHYSKNVRLKQKQVS